MRAIKFRAWDKNRKIMIGTDCLNNWADGDKDEWYGNVPRMCLEGIEEINTDPNFVVMQFTGLHDKNGKEVYEGDILHNAYGDNRCKFCGKSDPDNMTYIVLWKDESGEWLAETKELITEGGNYLTSDSWKDWAEVIGNIYKNPELLKEVI